MVCRGSQVSVVLVNFNSGGLLDRSLSALAAQSESGGQVIVVDNGSTDGSTEGLEARYPGVEVVRQGENVGFAKANNRAVREFVRHPWVALLNADAFPERDWLLHLTRAATSHPGFCAFASKLLMDHEPDRLDGAGDSYHTSGMAWREGHGQIEETGHDEPREVFSACAAAALIRKDAFLEVGGFDEAFFCYFEDVDLAFRLRLRGHRVLYVPQAVARHVGSASAGKGSSFTVYHGHRNRVWTFVKNMPSPLFWRYVPQHILANLLSAAWHLVRGRCGAVLRGQWDALRGLPASWQTRKAIQADRRVGAAEIGAVMAHGLLTPYIRRFR
jgi:GT2 family glycosyltransferase